MHCCLLTYNALRDPKTVKGLAFSRATEDLIKLDLHDAAAFEKLCEDFKPDVV